MAKNKEKEKKHNGGFITVIVLLAVLLAALAGIAVLSTLGYFGGSSSEDESSEVDESSDVEESDTTTDSNENEQTHTHTYELTYVAPTCTEDGSVTLTCTECGDTYTEKIDKLGHDWDNAYYAHDEENHWLVCPRCGTTSETEAHSMVDTTIDPTHEGAGLKVSVCSICDYQTSEAIDPTGHNYTSVTTKEPSCEEEGEITYTCDCGATYTEAIPATGHTFGSGTLTTVPTCTSEGEISFTCSVCHKTYTETVDMLPHDFSQNIYVGNGEYHQLRCANCEALDSESIEACTYENGIYTTGDDGYLHGVCDKCGSLSSEVITELPASTDGTYTFDVNSEAGLTNALEALNKAERDDDAEPSTITLTEDLDLTEDSDSAYEFSASNFILDGGEDGVTLDVGNQSVVSGENVTFSNLTLDGSDVSGSTRRNAAVNVTGKDVTFDGCTIVGGESTQPGNGLDTAGIIVTSSEANSTITVSNCDITGADRAIYFYNAASDINLYVSDTYLEAVYAFNKTGSGTGSITFVNSTLMGWTSYAESGEVTFTGCTFGFGDNNANQCYGYLRGYSDATFTDCLFRSFVSRQAETEKELTNLCSGEEPIGHDNYMFGVGAANVVYTLLNCSFEHVSDTAGSTNYSVETLTADNAGYLMSTDYAKTSYSACGFKFSTNEDATVYTYSDYSSLFGAGN